MHGKIDAWEEKEIYGEELDEKNEMESEIPQDNTPEDAYAEPVDYSASQDSLESLGTKLGTHKKRNEIRIKTRMNLLEEVIETWTKKMLK